MNTQVLEKTTANGKVEVFYPETDGKIKGYGDFHYHQIRLLYSNLQVFFESRKDVYFSSGIMFYYEEGNPNRCFAPDLMVCFGAENKKRRTYKLWEEKIVPQVVVEVVSKETWQKDVTTKRRLYEKLGVEEYFIIDPEYKYLPSPLFAYRLEFGELVRQAVENKRIFSQALGLELVDTGEDFRFFNPETKEFLPTNEDLQAKIEMLETELARIKGQKK